MKPFDYNEKDLGLIGAVKAFRRGDASQGQMSMVWNFIVAVLCHADEVSFRPDPYQTAFLEGQRSVAFELRRIAALPVDDLVPKKQ